MRIVVAGGSGLIGSRLAQELQTRGDDVVFVTRNPRSTSEVGWTDLGAAVEGADAVVNLAGESIGGGRWTSARKERILASRVDTTDTLVAAISAADVKPRVLVNASGVGIYGDSGDAVVDESAPPGSDFLSEVCVAWEAAAARAPVRWVAMRTALVVGRGAQSLKLMALPFRLGVGGRLGSGRQWFPWIHLDDLVALYVRAIDDDGLGGTLNAVAPQQLQQREAARDLGHVLHRPSLVPTPAPALRLLLGEQADLLLHGQRAVSSRLDGFGFRHQTLQAALEEALA
jgi:uncharacterized protein (TIGR01777 family)